MSYTELADNLPVITKQERRQLQMGTVYDWVEESQDIANELYSSVEIGDKLGYRYSYVYWDTVEQQLLKGGLRLAAVLNELFR
jgi:negative regulator of sigma E activity